MGGGAVVLTRRYEDIEWLRHAWQPMTRHGVTDFPTPMQHPGITRWRRLMHPTRL